jgi:DNA-binding NarL/FixJ family response regulator
MAQNAKIPLFIADEQALFRQGLAHKLSLYPDLEVLGVAASEEEAMAALQGLPPCVMVVCSLTLSPFQDLLRRVRRQLPSASILAVADASNPEAIFQAASSGAQALLSRSTPAESWAKTISEVNCGGHPIDRDLADPRVARRLLGKFQELSSQPGLASILTTLATREADLLRSLAQGTPLEEIGQSLQAATQDLRRYLTSIRRKLEVNSLARETALALRGGKE